MNIEKIISKMSLEEKVGQLFMVGFKGTEVTPKIRELIKKYYVGGIIYFRQNIKSLKQIASISNSLQQISLTRENGVPLIISTDQEGGTVTRLTGGTHFPGNMTLGAANDLGLAEKAGKGIGRELKAVGINMDLAPVLDVNNNPDNPVIGVRSYGEDPKLVAELGKAFIRGLQSEGIMACAKHFPGHGDTSIDSHLGLASINHNKEHLKKVELYPFQEAIKAGIDSIMSAHIYFPAFESVEGKPATLSYSVLTNLLRNEMGFKGLIITDSMTMDAVAKTYGTVQGVVMALEAGADMVIMTLKKQQEAIEEVYKAVREGRISEKRIDDSVRRILTLKKNKFASEKDLLADDKLVDIQEDGKIAYQIAESGVTLIKDEKGILANAEKRYKRVTVFDFPMDNICLVEDEGRQRNSFVEGLKDAGIEVQHYTITGEEKELPFLTETDLIIICTYDALHDDSQVKLVKKLNSQVESLLVLAIRNPYDLRAFPEVSTYLTTYDFSPVNLLVASEIIAGKVRPKGKLPITI